ncbi:MAG: DNA polymerase III subunit gamma/tau [Peptococcaceae bacterium]|nr:DNA polymerase III subunit gamma/tau [Peptococcaceae bacterium]
MAYLALYREWRPRTFDEVVGQDHVVRTLVNALKNQKLSHAYLFCGPRGTGKTSIARILAKAVNCLRPDGGNPCGQCGTCREIETGACMDVTEIDAASNRGIDEVRELREKVRFAPSSGKVRVFIIDEVHMLTNEAFNALLKTLEEPPAQAMLILATTEPHRVPLTILSRCQRFDFHRIGDRDMLEHLGAVAQASGISISPEALELVVRAAEGAVRDGLSILDQAAAYGGNCIGVDEIHGILGTVREDLLNKAARWLMEGRAGDVLGLVGEISDQGKDLRIFLRELNSHLRRVLLEKLDPEGPGGEEIDRLSLVIHRLAAAEQDMRWSSQPRVLLEVAMVRAARVLAGAAAGDAGRVGELAARLREIEGLVARLAGRVNGEGSVTGQCGTRPDPPPAEVPGRETRRAAVPPAAGHGPDPGREKTAEAAGSGRKEGRVDNSPASSPPGGLKNSPAGPAGLPAGNEAPAAGKAGDPVTKMPDLLKKIDSRWNDILEVARRACPHIASYLTQGKGWPLELEGNTLTIGFPRAESYAPVAVGILESEANRRELSGLIKEVCQADLRIRLVATDRKPPGRAGQTKKTVQSGDIEALFGKEEGDPADAAEDFDARAADLFRQD